MFEIISTGVRFTVWVGFSFSGRLEEEAKEDIRDLAGYNASVGDRKTADASTVLKLM